MRSPADHPGALHDHQGHHEQTHDHGSHDGHAGHSVDMFRDRFWLSLILTLPVVYFSETIQGWLGYTAPAVAGSELIPPVLGTVIFVYGGWPFLRGAVREAGDRQPGMMLLIGMAITVAFLASLATTLGRFDLEFWWELAALITIMLLGHWMEMRAIGQARSALEALASCCPTRPSASRVTKRRRSPCRTWSSAMSSSFVLAAADGQPDRMPAMAAAAESESDHPLARAVASAARERGHVPRAAGFKAMSGRGVEATVNRSKVAVGGPALLQERGIEIPKTSR